MANNASIKIGADLTELQKSLKQATVNIRDTKRELEVAKSSFLNFANSTDSLNKVVEKQEKVYKACSDKVELLKQALDKANNASNKNEDQIKKLTRQYETAQIQMNKAGGILSEYKTKLEQLEKDHLEFAEIINDFIAEPRTNGQLHDLANQIKNYLIYSSKELHEYNEYVDTFVRLMEKLP